jgi:hypothetical protein
MSQIVLSRYPSRQEKLVVGYDHPCNGAFWQEFNEEPADGDYPPGWDEVLRQGGFFKGIPLDEFRESVPEDLRPLITDHVMELLSDHMADPDSGYNATPIDLSANVLDSEMPPRPR